MLPGLAPSQASQLPHWTAFFHLECHHLWELSSFSEAAKGSPRTPCQAPYPHHHLR